MATIVAANAYARLATLLDEAKESFWSEAARYQALSDGQRAVTTSVLKVFQAMRVRDISASLPIVLKDTVKQVTANLGTPNTTTIALPADYLDYVNFTYTPATGVTLNPYIMNVTPETPRLMANSYFGSGDTVYVLNGNINLGFPSGTGASYVLNYIADPADMSSSVDGVLSDRCQNAVVTWAYANLLKKDNRLAESQAELQRFDFMVQELVY